MRWELVLARRAVKQLKKVPKADRERIEAALVSLRDNPFAGDIRPLKGLDAFRRRVGNWRIIYGIHAKLARIEVAAILRRTSTTY